MLNYLKELDRALVDLYISLDRVDALDFIDQEANPSDTGRMSRNGTYPYYYNGTFAVPMVRHVGARVHNSANQSIADATETALTFNTERYDTDAFHSTVSNTSRLTAPFAGLYLVGGNVRFTANATGRRALSIRLGGATNLANVQLDAASADLDACDMAITTAYVLAATNYVELTVYQNSTGTLDVVAAGNFSPEFWIAYLGPTT